MSLKQQKKYKKQEEDEKIKKYKFSENDKKQFFSMNIQIDPQIPAQKLKVFPLSDPYKLSWQVLEDTGLNEEHYQIVFNQIAKYQRKLKLYIINKNKNQQQYKNQPNHINQYSETYNSPYTSPSKNQIIQNQQNQSPQYFQQQFCESNNSFQTQKQPLSKKQNFTQNQNFQQQQQQPPRNLYNQQQQLQQENIPNQYISPNQSFSNQLNSQQIVNQTNNPFKQKQSQTQNANQNINQIQNQNDNYIEYQNLSKNLESPNFKQQVFHKNNNNSPNNLQEAGVQTDSQTLKLKQIEIRSNNSSPDKKVIQDIHLKFEQENSPNQSKEIIVIEKEQQQYQDEQQQIQSQISKYQQKQNNQQFLEQITEIPESNIQSEMNSHINSTQNQQINPQSQNINTQNSQQEQIQEIKSQTHDSNINLKDQEQIKTEQKNNQNEQNQNINQYSQIPQSNNFQPLSQQQFQQPSSNPQNLAQTQNQFQPQHFIPMIPYILPFNNQVIPQFNSYNPYQNHLSSFKLNQNPLDFEIYQHSNPQSKRSNSQEGETEENKEKEKNSKNSQNKQKTKNDKHTIQQKKIQTQRTTQTKVSSQLLSEIDEYKRIKDSLKQYQTLNQPQQINNLNEQKTDSESSIPENIIEKPETLFLERQNQQNNDQYLRQISSQKNQVRSPSPIQTQRTDFSRFSKISEPEINNAQPLNIEKQTNYLDYKNEKLQDNLQTSSQYFRNLNQNQDLTEINQLKLQELYQKQQESLNQQLQQLLQTQTQIQQTQQSVLLYNSTNSIHNNIQQIQQEISQSQQPQIFQNQDNQKIYQDQNNEKKIPQQQYQQQSELLQSPVQRNVETFGKKETQNIKNNQDLVNNFEIFQQQNPDFQKKNNNEQLGETYKLFQEQDDNQIQNQNTVSYIYHPNKVLEQKEEIKNINKNLQQIDNKDQVTSKPQQQKPQLQRIKQKVTKTSFIQENSKNHQINTNQIRQTESLSIKQQDHHQQIKNQNHFHSENQNQNQNQQLQQQNEQFYINQQQNQKQPGINLYKCCAQNNDSQERIFNAQNSQQKQIKLNDNQNQLNQNQKQDQNQKQQNNINLPQNQDENNYQQQYDYYLLNSQRDSVMKQHQNQYKSPNNHKQCNNCSCLNDSFQGSVQFDEGIESQFQSVQNKNDQNKKDIYSKLIDASPQSSYEKRGSNYQTIQKKNQNLNNTEKETPKRKYLNLDNTQHIENDFTNEMFLKQNQNNNFNKIEPQKIENLIDPSQQKLTISQKQQQPKQPKSQIHPQTQEKIISQANRSNTQQSSSSRTQYELKTDRELEQNPFENKQITTQKIKNKFRSTPTQYTSNKKTLTLEVDKEEQEANPIVFTDSVYSEMESKEQFLNSTARIPPNKWNDIQVSVSGNDFIVLQKSKNKELVDELNGYQYKLLLKLFQILDEEGLGYIQSVNIDPFKRLNGSLRLLCQQVLQFALNQKSQVFFQDFIVSASLTKVIGDLFKLSKSYLGEQNNTLNSHQYTENLSQNNQYTQQSQY